MLNSKFWPPAAQEDESLMIVFTVNTASGEINSSTLDCSTIYATNSDSQLMATSVHSIAVASISRNFDFVLSCNVFQPGKFGGLHGGEPLIDPRLSNPAYQPSFFSASTPKANIGWSTFSWAGPSGGWAYSQWSYFRRPTPAGGDNTVPALAAQPTAPSQGALRSTYTTNGTAVEFALHKCAMLPQYVPWGQ
jgi:hypothetical protein